MSEQFEVQDVDCAQVLDGTKAGRRISLTAQTREKRLVLFMTEELAAKVLNELGGFELPTRDYDYGGSMPPTD